MTTQLRIKETDADYGYIIDPDLVLIDITPASLQQISSQMPELADAKFERYLSEHNIAEDTAHVLSKDKDLATFFDTVSIRIEPSTASNWVRRELPRVLNYNKKKLIETCITPERFICLLELVVQKKITDSVAKKVLERMVTEELDVLSYVREHGLERMSDTTALTTYCTESINEHPTIVADIRSGNTKAFNFLVGQVMKKAGGKAAPTDVHTELQRQIGL